MNREHLVAMDELLDRCPRLGRIASAVLVDDFDLASVYSALIIDRAIDRDGAVVDRIAVNADRAGERSEHAELDRIFRDTGFGLRTCDQQRGQRGTEQCVFDSGLHGSPPG